MGKGAKILEVAGWIAVAASLVGAVIFMWVALH
jgi:hypothetical protein